MEESTYQPLFPDKKVSARTGKITLACVGFAPTTRSQAPWDDPDTIIMGLNEAYVHNFMKRWDIWLQIHTQRNFMRPDNENDPGHRYWLMQDWATWLALRKKAVNPNPKLDQRVVALMTSKKIPILMQRAYTEIPNSVEYPLQEAKLLVPECILRHNGGRYFTSSAAFMLAWGILEGFERIEFYGFEMASDTEYFRQRAAMEFWIALAAAGYDVDVYLPPNCGILKDQIYGFERMSVGFEQKMEMMVTNLEQQDREQQWQFQKLLGAREQTKALMEKRWTDPQPEFDRLSVELEKQQNVVMQIPGAKQQQAHVLKFYRTYPFEEDDGDWKEKSEQPGSSTGSSTKSS